MRFKNSNDSVTHTTPEREADFQTRLILALRVVVVAVIVGGAWWFAVTLPPEEASPSSDAKQLTMLRVNLHDRDKEAANGKSKGDEPSDLSLKLYPVDVAVVQREFLTERRAGVSFDDFVTRRMAGRTPIEAHFDERGQATAEVPAGRWWVYASRRRGAEEVMWRLPVNVRGREQDVNLTAQNAYMRTRDF
ncbi:MAG: hypothetical protein MSG64_12315 [Pyrinomonadaceae bacterium MAG19_C2-C3]|nr:hypothetical protein [Pyrinomonadaceae bacterium MAG19_C2-C3]